MFKSVKKARSGEGGFTLIELLIVVIILAILAAIVVFAVGSTGQNSAVASCKADAKSVETALEAYKVQNGAYPGTADDWTSLTTSNANGGPWLKSQPGSAHYQIHFAATTGVVSVTKADGTNSEAFDNTTACEDNAST